MNFDNSDQIIQRGFRLTKEQLNYLAEGSYGFVTKAGKSYYRDLKVIAQDKISGKVVVRETVSGDYDYEKDFVLSSDGMSEKLKFKYQTSPIKWDRFNIFKKKHSS